MRVIGPGPGRGVPGCTLNAGRGTRSKPGWGGEAGTGKGKMLWAELGRRRKSQRDRCRKAAARANAGLGWAASAGGCAH